MTLEIEFFNIWAVLAGFLSNMVIGALWYSPLLFGTIWLKLIGKTADDITKQDANRSMMFSVIPGVLLSVLMAVLLGFIGPRTVLDAIGIATLVSAGFIGMSALNLVIYEGRSFKLLLINVGYSLVSLNVLAVILTLWK